jgi:phosphoserine phosphatase RsbU/P
VGHGVPAALMTVYLKQSLRTKEIDPAAPGGYSIVSPERALTALNREVVQHQGEQVRTATAWYGLLNHRTLELSHARAGHPLPLLLKPDGRVLTLEAEGGILGVFPHEQYGLSRTTLEPGDRLLVYSDGFEVAFQSRQESAVSAKKSLANRQYVEEFKDLGHGALHEALGRLSRNLDAQAGSLNQLDDMTVLVVGVCSSRTQQSGAAAGRTVLSGVRP